MRSSMECIQGARRTGSGCLDMTRSLAASDANHPVPGTSDCVSSDSPLRPRDDSVDRVDEERYEIDIRSGMRVAHRISTRVAGPLQPEVIAFVDDLVAAIHN